MFQRIWAIGDIHGSYAPIENFWERNKNTINFSRETDCIILLGDVGTNYYLNKRDKKFKNKLQTYPFTYFCIRGNHEERASTVASQNPDKWYLKNFFNNKVYIENDFPYINYALDEVTVYLINNYKTLVIPGAYSVDKYYRIYNKWPWFKDEQLSSKEIDDGRCIVEKYNYNFDLILSHTCPIAYEPRDLFLSQIDQSKVDKTMECFLGEIEWNTTYKLWVWGHYHSYRIYPQFQNSQCIMLSAGEEAINVQEWLENIKEIHKKY